MALGDAGSFLLDEQGVQPATVVAGGHVLQGIELVGDECVRMGVEEGADQAVPGSRLADEHDVGANRREVPPQAETGPARRDVGRGIAPQHGERPYPAGEIGPQFNHAA